MASRCRPSTGRPCGCSRRAGTESQREVAGPYRGARYAVHGTLHGTRLCDHPRGAARRAAGVDRNLGRQGASQVGAGPRDANRWRVSIMGAAWGARIAGIEVRVDNGPWIPATIDEGPGSDCAWKFWSVAWPDATPVSTA